MDFIDYYANKLTHAGEMADRGPSPFNVFADLSANEKMIIDFVTKNPGVTKQGIVNAFYGGMARATVFGNIGRLSDLEVISIKKERPNSQVHQVFINNDSLLTAVIQTLNKFELLFINIINKIESKFDEKTVHHKLTSSEMEDIDIISFCLFSIYMEFVRIYMSKALITWPQKTRNRNLVNRLHLILFARMSNLQLTLSNALPRSFGLYKDPKYPNEDSKLYSFDSLYEFSASVGKKYGIDKDLSTLTTELIESREYPLIPMDASGTTDNLRYVYRLTDKILDRQRRQEAEELLKKDNKKSV